MVLQLKDLTRRRRLSSPHTSTIQAFLAGIDFVGNRLFSVITSHGPPSNSTQLISKREALYNYNEINKDHTWFSTLVLIIVNRDLSSSTSFNTSFDNCSVQLIFSILRHAFISKASNFVMSSFLIVLISAQSKVTLQISVFTILFLRHLHSSQSSPW